MVSVFVFLWPKQAKKQTQVNPKKSGHGWAGKSYLSNSHQGLIKKRDRTVWFVSGPEHLVYCKRNEMN